MLGIHKPAKPPQPACHIMAADQISLCHLSQSLFWADVSLCDDSTVHGRSNLCFSSVLSLYFLCLLWLSDVLKDS